MIGKEDSKISEAITRYIVALYHYYIRKFCLCFFPTCQVRVIRFYVSCLLLSSPPYFLLISSLSPPPPRRLPPAQPRPSTHSGLCRISIIHAQYSLPDLNHDHHRQYSLPDLNRGYPRPVFPAGPQARPYTPSISCRTSTTTIPAQYSLPDLNHDHPRPVFPAGSTVSIHAKCSLPDLM